MDVSGWRDGEEVSGQKEDKEKVDLQTDSLEGLDSGLCPSPLFLNGSESTGGQLSPSPLSSPRTVLVARQTTNPLPPLVGLLAQPAISPPQIFSLSISLFSLSLVLAAPSVDCN